MTFCPNVVKAEIERVKKHQSTSEEDIPNDMDDTEHLEQPEWMELVKPMATFEDIQAEISFEDREPDYDWSKTSFEYPQG